MILVLENGQQVNSNDTEALEKAASVLEQEALEAATALDLEKAAEKGELTPEKAKKILHDGEVHGRPLTEQQRKYFGAVAGGTAKKSESGAGESMAGVDALEQFSKAIYIGPRGGRWLDPKHTIPWKAEGAKKPAAAEKPAGKIPPSLKGDILVNGKRHTVATTWKPESDNMGGHTRSYRIVTARGKEKNMIEHITADGKSSFGVETARRKYLTSEVKDVADKKKVKRLDAKGREAAEEIAAYHESMGDAGQVMYSGEHDRLEWVREENVAESKAAGYKKVKTGGKPSAAKEPAKKEGGGEKPAMSGDRKQEIKDIGEKQRKAYSTAYKQAVASGKAADYRQAAAYASNMVTVMRDLGDKEGASDWQVKYHQSLNAARYAKYEKPAEIKEASKKTEKSLSVWIDEQEADMTNENADLLKALGDDAELAKGMMGYGGKRITEWADQFYQDTGLETQALQCVKDMIACQKRWEAHHKGGNPVEEMSRKRGLVIQKEEDAIRMKMRDLESKLVDYRIKQAGMRQAMGKSGDAVVDVDVEVVKGETGTSVLVNYLEKGGGPFIGPRGGKWADASHTIPWSEAAARGERERREGVKKLGEGMSRRIEETKKEAKEFGPKIVEALKDHALAKKYGHRFGASVAPLNIGGIPGLTITLKAGSLSESTSLLSGLAKELGFPDKSTHAPKAVGSRGAAFIVAPSGSLKQALGRLTSNKPPTTKKSEGAMSGTEILQDYLEKAQTMPTGEPGMSRGPEDGADLARVKGPTGSVDSSAGPPIGAPGPGKKTKLSEDDDEVENQLKGRKKPIERMTGKSMAVPGHQREMVAHENAQLVSALRKGPDDITIGPGVPAPVAEPGPVHKANRWVQGEDSLVVYGDGSDAAAARLVKGEDFYAGGQAPALGRNPMALNQRKPCRACGATMAKSLSVCPHCGDGAGLQKQGTLRIAAGAVRNGPGLRPSRGAADIVIK